MPRIDAVYDAAIARGITPVFITFWAPVWATKYRNCGLLDFGCRAMARSDSKLVPDWPFLDEYETFVRAVKERWPRALIEAWNEPNLYWNHPNFRGSRDYAAYPRLYAAIQCAAYRASKSVNDDPVLSAGWAGWKFSDYLDGVYAAGGRECWDIMSLHTYSGRMTRLGENSFFAQAFDRVRTLQAAHGDDAPIWVTELGWTTSGSEHRVSEAEQADVARRAYNRLATMPDVDAVLFHTVRDAPLPESPYNEPSHAQYGYGFLREDWVPKAAYCHFADAASTHVQGCAAD